MQRALRRKEKYAVDVTQLSLIPPWQWPAESGYVLAKVLEDRQAPASKRLLAAELAGEIVAMSDELADVLLSLLADAGAAAELRAQAAVSLGPVLEQMDLDSDGLDEFLDELDDQPISELTFHRIQETLRARYRQADLPKLVRRRILEASVRAPRDWHRDAIRAAYADADREWRLTAVFAMGYVRGFDPQIVAALEDADDEIRYEAVGAAGNWGVDAAWPYVANLLTSADTDKLLLLAAIEAAASIRPEEARPMISDLTDSADAEVAQAASTALVMTLPIDDPEFDEEPGPGNLRLIQ